jgi:release factor glutamine methyltransferase
VSSGTGRSTEGAKTVADAASVAALLAEAGRRGLAPLDAQLLLARAAGLSRAMLMAHGERGVAAAGVAQFRAECARRASGEPLAYIEGHKEFWSLDLVVTPDVLVPRPETELLVERCLALLPADSRRVADLGTGSGAIALALARERPNWAIAAVDASSPALAVARGNAARLGLANIRFLHGSWCDALHAADARGTLYDAIVSNPPYVASGDAALEPLRHEPRSALASGPEGFDDLLRIIDAAPGHMAVEGWLLLEHGATQASRIRERLLAAGWRDVATRQDLAGLDRVSEARRPIP